MTDAMPPAFDFKPGDESAVRRWLELRIHDAPRDRDAKPEISPERVAAIRAEIESGRYLTNEKLDVVVDRLLDELTRG